MWQIYIPCFPLAFGPMVNCLLEFKLYIAITYYIIGSLGAAYEIIVLQHSEEKQISPK